MSIPRTDPEIRRIVKNEALQTYTARRVFRKAGILLESIVLPRPRTIVDGIINPLEHNLARMWLVDLTNATQIRFTCESNVTMFLNRMTSTDATALDATWTAMMGANSSNATVNLSASRTTTDAGDLLWRTIPEPLRGPQRFCLGHSSGDPSLDPNRLDGPFSFAVQVKEETL